MTEEIQGHNEIIEFVKNKQLMIGDILTAIDFMTNAVLRSVIIGGFSFSPKRQWEIMEIACKLSYLCDDGYIEKMFGENGPEMVESKHETMQSVLSNGPSQH